MKTFLAGLVLVCLFAETMGLSKGMYPEYNFLCTAPGIKEADFDCTGFIQCSDTLAFWHSCPPNQYFDGKVSCNWNKENCKNLTEVANSTCRENPTLLFAHPESCSMFYNCSRAIPHDGMLQYEDECPYPLFFNADDRNCTDPHLNPNITCQGPKPLDQCAYRLQCGRPVCTGLPDGKNAYNTQPFDVEYVICKEGKVESTHTCTGRGEVFDPVLRDCTMNYQASIQTYCESNPSAIFASPASCSLYYNCSSAIHNASLDMYMAECSYRSLFNPVAKTCDLYKNVMCGLRSEPKAPCDYRIGHCLLQDTCLPCEASCKGLPDGGNMYPGKPLTAEYLLCEGERTNEIKSCPSGKLFDPAVQDCVSSISTETLEAFCAKNPTMILPHPGQCSQFYDCQKTTAAGNFPKFLKECFYPQLFDGVDNMCKDPQMVTCDQRIQPQGMCDYLQFKCVTKNCVPCSNILPSCALRADGNWPLVGEELTANYIECVGGQFAGTRQCQQSQLFDINTRICTDTITLDAMKAFCALYPNSSVANPQHCGQFYECPPDGATTLSVSECDYPDEYSISAKTCRDYRAVDCKERTKVVDGCQYQGIGCPANTPTCSCTFPSCNGRPDGMKGTFIGENSRYYFCRDNRTIVVNCVSPSTYDPFLRDCSPLDTTTQPTGVVTTTPSTVSTTQPTTVDDVDSIQKAQLACVARPTALIPHSMQCHWYYNCSDLSSEKECSYPFLFDDVSTRCVEYSLATCGRRYEAKPMCQYNEFRNEFPMCGSTGYCAICEQAYPSCVGRPSNYRNGIASDMSKYYECRDERTIMATCQTGYMFDGTNCSPIPPSSAEASSAQEASIFCAQDRTLKIPHRDYCARYFDCQGKITPVEDECPYPEQFDATAKMCGGNTICGTRPEQKAPCSYYGVVRTYSMCEKDMPCPECAQEYPSCEGKPDKYKGPHQLDEILFYVCNNERTTIDACPIGTVFLPATKLCGTYKAHAPLDPLPPNYVDMECAQNPSSVHPMIDSCARYYDCSLPNSPLGWYIAECEPTLLFDSIQAKCIDASKAHCFPRPAEVDRCEYEIVRRNYCQGPGPCPACHAANPSCKGKPDHFAEALPLDNTAFYTCINSRTTIGKCLPGEVFSNVLNRCEMPSTQPSTTVTTPPPVTTPAPTTPTTLPTTTPQPGPPIITSNQIMQYCALYPRDAIAHPDSCAQFWNCSQTFPEYGVPYLSECRYPMFFNRETSQCDDFSVVNCGNRKEVITPCEYIAFTMALCGNLSTCPVCDNAQLSCRGKADGYKDAMPQADNRYFQCQSQRTTIAYCQQDQRFDPITADCKIPGAPTIPVIATVEEADATCFKSPNQKFPHAENCAQYFDCAVQNGAFGRYLSECPYPDLYHPASASCRSHSLVSCGRRYEPRLRCEYYAILMNYCRILGTNCQECTNDNPSCIAQTNGLSGPIPGSTNRYYTCENERTFLKECPTSFEFDTATRHCSPTKMITSPAEAAMFCAQHQTAIYPSAISCSRYFNCSATDFGPYGPYLSECPYPDLYDILSQNCMPYYSVRCGIRPEPKDPCQYLANDRQYTGVDCTKPSCVGLTDGSYHVPGRELGREFTECRDGRSSDIRLCPQHEYFDPVNKNCRSVLTQIAVNFFCKIYQNRRVSNPINCAQYINCYPQLPQIIECGYPRLFNGTMCVDPEFVTCGERYEPMAPCEYEQNKHCPNEPNCAPCEQRIPSCVGLPDGDSPYPGLPPSPLFVKCKNNRTDSVIRCRGDLFNPLTKQCDGGIPMERIMSACRQYPDAVIADPQYCNRYYDCSNTNRTILNSLYIQECKYPGLFSMDYGACVNIIRTPVYCGKRYVPVDACEYHQHCGYLNYPNCANCTRTIPSCRGMSGGKYLNNPPTNPMSNKYFLCFQERTVSYGNCSMSYRFDYTKQDCVPLSQNGK